MRIVYPDVEYLPIDATKTVHLEHLLKCARITHAADENAGANLKLVGLLYDKQHYSVFRHVPHYYILNKSENIPLNLMTLLHAYQITNHPFINIQINNKAVYVSTNEHFLIDNPSLKEMLNDYEVTPEIFEKEGPLGLIYYSFKCTTQISTTRELNRVSPNAICEESTRYCNYSKDKFNGQIAVCVPHWFKFKWDIKTINVNADYKLVSDIKEIYVNDIEILNDEYDRFAALKYILDMIYDERDYLDLLEKGLKPEDARGKLPLDTASNVIYTYTLDQWVNILKLRYFGTTGRPHPNAKIIACKIYDILSTNPFNKQYILSKSNISD